MKAILKTLAFCCGLLAGISLPAQVSQADIEKSLERQDLSHPYLLFDREGKERILESVERDPRQRAVYNKLLMEAYRHLKMPVYDKVPQAGDLSRFFSGDEMRYFTGQHNEAALNLAFAYQLTGEKKYADKAFLHAEMLCRLESWVYPFHEFPQIYDRVWPWGVDDDQVLFSYDLQSARIGTHMALVYDWIYEAMDKAQRDRIRGAILKNNITRVRGNFEYHWWASAHRCNWSGICFSGAGISSLALLTEDPQLTDVVATAYNGVYRMLDELGVDGGWQEGRGYWNYGLGHSVWFMDAIKNLSGGDYDLFAHPRLKDNPVDFALYTLPANFGDGRSGPVGSSWFINKLAAETGDHTAAWYSREFILKGSTIYDLIWPETAVECIEPPVKSKHFRTIDWAVMRSSFKPSPSFTIACKAGLNDDPHHGHLDCGHFKLEYKGVDLIVDLGGAKYDDYYFSAERWDYIEASSEGHNVVTVNGEGQISAKYKDRPWTEGVGGTIEGFFSSDSLDRLIMTGLQNAYPGNEMNLWERELILLKPSLLVVSDRVGSAKGAEIRSRLHPGGDFMIHEGYFTIGAEGQRIAVVPFSDRPLSIEPGKTGSITVNENVDFQWIDHLDCVLHAASASSRAGYLIFPLEGDAADAKEVLASMDLEKDGREGAALSFRYAGKEFSIELK